jgi:ubiquinone/menaquinone biosynthesis C-methylase UbiE
MSREVRAFFDDHATSYQELDAGLRAHHRWTARRLHAALSGRVMTVGGLWREAELAGLAADLVVTDLSPGMLRTFRDRASRLAAADALALPFADATFDHAVAPLVLHHIAGASVAEARRHLRAALREVHRVLVPGGRLWISELCVSAPVYAAERFCAPLTRALLAAVHEPFVAMHPAAVYARELGAAGFAGVAIERPRPEGTGPFDAITPVIAARWLKIPRFAFPLAPTLISATRGAS